MSIMHCRHTLSSQHSKSMSKFLDEPTPARIRQLNIVRNTRIREFVLSPRCVCGILMAYVNETALSRI